MINNQIFADMLARPVREFRGRVEIYEGSTLTQICGCHDALQSFTIERAAEAKFFGYGICQKLNVILLDHERKFNITTANDLEAVFGKDSDYIYAFPKFNVSEVHRDENTNELSITAYDDLYRASAHKVSELELPPNSTLKEYMIACANLLNLPLNLVNIPEAALNIVYENGANLSGDESIRDALTALAEATQSIYYINNEWQLTFKGLDLNGEAALTIDKQSYITLESGENRRLSTIVHATELGDNVSVTTGLSGTTQYVRNNPFWDMREDIDSILNNAIAAVGNLTINQLYCEWRGNFLLEIGDKIDLVTKDNNYVSSYLLNDSLSFDGSLSQTTEWNYEDNDEESADNPVGLAEALKKTYARVDKANREIELLISETGGNKDSITNLVLNTENITASVKRLETSTNEAVTGLNTDITNLSSQVEAKMSAEDVKISIQSELANGVSKVVTTTGFTFNDDGLTVSKTGSEMTTTITEDGMIVYRDETAVLTANNIGVDAVNLHATTYLIIGTNSRIEDYEYDRTGCFWIGGNS